MEKILIITGIRLIRLVVSFLGAGILFAIIPLAHSFFQHEEKSEEEILAQREIIMRRIEKEEKKPEKRTPRIRQMKTTGKRARSRSFTMKFAPDLGIGNEEGVEVADRNLENMVFEEGETDEPPVPISRMSVPYPLRAKEAGIEGTVSLVIEIDRRGKVSRVNFEHVPSPLFVKSIRQVVSKWRFKPARHKGVPVRVRVRQNIEFNLEK